MELQRTQGAKVEVTLEIQAEAPEGFPKATSASFATMLGNSNSRPSRPVSKISRQIASPPIAFSGETYFLMSALVVKLAAHSS
jgi:hypothetical protein